MTMYAQSIAEEFVRRAGAAEAGKDDARTLLRVATPAQAVTNGRQFFIADLNGKIVAAEPEAPHAIGKLLIDIFGPSQPLTVYAERAGVIEFTIPSGKSALATVRNLRDDLGQIASLQLRDSALENWWRDTRLTATLVTTTSVVLLILGFAFHWQSTRARKPT